MAQACLVRIIDMAGTSADKLHTPRLRINRDFSTVLYCCTAVSYFSESRHRHGGLTARQWEVYSGCYYCSRDYFSGCIKAKLGLELGNDN